MSGKNADGTQSVITATPLGGQNWPDVIVVRFYDRLMRGVGPIQGTVVPESQYETEVVSDSGTIEIRWDAQYFNCHTNDNSYGRAADEIVFPRGMRDFSFMTSTTITTTNACEDVSLGIQIPAGETFTDVDFYVAGL